MASSPPAHEVYQHGHHASVVSNHAKRTAEREAAFFLGELRPGHRLLDVGCGPGSITAGLAIYDTMQFIKNNVVTYCIGQAASMGAFLLLAGTKGKRFALPNSRILIHQPSMGGISGQATDIDIHAREILRIREITNNLMARHTGQPLDRIERDVERDFIMNAQQAKEYGIVDEIIDRPRT